MRIDRDQIRVVLILAALVALFIFAAYRPSLATAQNVRADIQRQKAQLGIAQNESRDLVRLVKNVEELRASLSGAQQYIPNENELADLLRNLSQTLDAQQVTGKELQTKAVIRGADYNVMPVDLKFTGSSKAVTNFITALETMPRLIRIDKLEVTCERNRPAKDTEKSSDHLKIHMELSTFFSDAAEGTR
jgi:Tfp pilus assembly protein PilO